MTIESSGGTKQKQKLFVLIGVAILCAVVFGAVAIKNSNSDEKEVSREEQRQNQREKASEILKKYNAPTTPVSIEDEWMELSNNEVRDLKKDNIELNERLAKLEAALKMSAASGPYSGANLAGTSPAYEDTSYSNQPNPGNKAENSIMPKSIQTPLPTALPTPIPSEVTVSPVSNYRSSAIDSLSGNKKKKKVQEIGFVDLTPIGSGADKEGKKKNTETYLPAGTFVKILMVGGVDAPTGGMAESNPVPILMKIIDLAVLPNEFSSDVDSCHVIGAATGDLSSERVMIRTEVMTCIRSNGDILEIPIKGYIAGEDGKNGLRGTVVSKQGSLIAKSLFSGFASGMSSSINTQYQDVSTSALGNVTTVDSDKVFESGLASGATNSLEKIADYYLKRANELYPIIEMGAGRIGEMVLTQGSFLDTAINQDDEDEYYDEY
ncbi:MAG: TrbI/VirB10 family protein [Colwellia sp.]